MCADQRGRAGVAALALLLASCTDGAETSRNGSVDDPRAQEQPRGREGHDGLLVAQASPPGHLASMTGQLAVRDGCVVLDNGAAAYHLVWPQGTVFDRARSGVVVTHEDGTRTTFSLGQTHRMPGGEASHIDGSSPAYLPPGNPACRGPGWIVSPAKPR